MLIVENKDTDSADRVLRKYKRKFDKVKLLYQIRGRRQFVKKSVQRRNQIIKARYRQLIESGVIEDRR